MFNSFGPKLPWLAAGGAILTMIVGTVFSLLYMIQARSLWPLFSHQGLLQLSTLAYAFLGALILSRQGRNVVGWLLLGTALFSGLTALATGYAVFQPAFGPTWLPASTWAAWLNRWLWLPTSALPTIFVFQFFPNGRLPGWQWSVVLWCTIIGLAGMTFSLALHPGPITSWDINSVNPYGLPGTEDLWQSVLDLSGLPLAVGVFGAIFGLIRRFRRSHSVERQQMKWLMYGVLLTVLGSWLSGTVPDYFALSTAAIEELGLIITSLSIIIIALSVGVAVLRHGLYEIDLVINRTLVYTVLTGIVITVYLLVVSGLGLLLGGRDSLGVSLLGVIAVALVAQPARARLQRAINRLMYGDRDEPYVALSRLGRRLENAFAPEAVLPSIVETVAETLKLPYAAISLDLPQESGSSMVVASHGTPAAAPLILPLVYQGDGVGHLMVGARSGEALAPADRRLLNDLARQAGAAVHAVRLTIELQRSRRRLVTAREAERRRLRRDLHDGLGSQLAALHLQLDTLRFLIPEHTDSAVTLAAELRDDIRDAIADIRRLVYELRPPTLDELGLTGTLRALAAQTTSEKGLQVVVNAPDTTPPLSAATEVGAYRIAQEALTNVLRHAEAQHCWLTLAFGSDLCLTVEDDGCGLPAGAAGGVGLRSMRERAAELGGSFVAERRPAGGARIYARLPLLTTEDEAVRPLPQRSPTTVNPVTTFEENDGTP